MLQTMILLLLVGSIENAEEGSFPKDPSDKNQEYLKYILRFGLRNSNTSSALEYCPIPGEPMCDDLMENAAPTCFMDRNKCEVEFSGDCKLWWQDSCHCDFMEWNLCGVDPYSFCCIKCKNAEPSSHCTSLKGSCKRNCGRFEFFVNAPCQYINCSCCVPCESLGCDEAGDGSRCVSSEAFCHGGHYVDQDACGGNCVCCKPCLATDLCRQLNGYPERQGRKCKDGYSSLTDDDSSPCMCCFPENQDEACKTNGDRNLSPADFCMPEKCPPNYYEYETGCSSTTGVNCRCCEAGGWQKCMMERECVQNAGFCSSTGCQCPNYVEKPYGCTSRDDVSCSCCQLNCTPRYSK